MGVLWCLAIMYNSITQSDYTTLISRWFSTLHWEIIKRSGVKKKKEFCILLITSIKLRGEYLNLKVAGIKSRTGSKPTTYSDLGNSESILFPTFSGSTSLQLQDFRYEN